MNTFDIIKINLIRSLKLWTRFRTSFIISIIAMFVSIGIFFFLGLAFGPAADAAVSMYGTTFFSFVLVGLAFNQYAAIAINDYLNSLKEVYFSNRLEIILLSSGIKKYLFSMILWSFIYTSFNFALFLIIGVWVFGASIVLTINWWAILVVLFLTIFSLSGIGLIAASVFLVGGAKGEVEPVSWLITALATLVSGVYYPVEKLPDIIQFIANFLPHTHALKASRIIFLSGSLTPEFLSSILYLMVFSLILFPLGLWLFNKSIRKGEKEGTLVRWA